MSDPALVRRFYRVVRTNPPTRQDFLSALELGRRLQPGLPQEVVRIFDGLSVSSTQAGTRYTAQRFPRSGSFIATLDIPDDGRFRIEQTTTRRTHWTIWGDADALLGCIIAVEPIS
jgi:hypothetical protein